MVLQRDEDRVSLYPDIQGVSVIPFIKRIGVIQKGDNYTGTFALISCLSSVSPTGVTPQYNYSFILLLKQENNLSIILGNIFQNCLIV